MRLKDILAGAKVFIDANIFLYPALKDRRFMASCRAFLKRVEAGEIQGFTSVLVLNEVLHQLMRMEIARARRMTLAGATRYLKANPNAIKRLKLAWKGMREIRAIPSLTICEVTEPLHFRGVEHSKSFGLLATDGAHIAVMEAQGLREMASNDPDFQRVPWIKLYQP